jgi:hypothetical protein
MSKTQKNQVSHLDVTEIRLVWDVLQRQFDSTLRSLENARQYVKHVEAAYAEAEKTKKGKATLTQIEKDKTEAVKKQVQIFEHMQNLQHALATIERDIITLYLKEDGGEVETSK